MARENLVTLTGAIVGKQIRYNDDQNPVRGTVILSTYTRGLGSKLDKGVASKFKAFQIPVVSRTEDIIRKIELLKDNDVIMIKGVVCTRFMISRHICDKCGQIDSQTVTRAFVLPIDFIVLKQGLSFADARNYTKEHAEFSNEINLIGNVCTDPKRLNNNPMSPLEYQVAINRTYRIKEDSEDIKTDYPWIVSYGTYAIEEEAVIQKGSQIMVNGFLKTRQFNKTCRCQSCNAPYTLQCQAMEITPYHVEYLRNCNNIDKDGEEITGSTHYDLLE